MASELDKSYFETLQSLKEKIRYARLKATLAVNYELISVYWEIGNVILQQQEQEGWGTKVIERLASDLKLEFPDMKGLSLRNIKYMRAFAEAYPHFVVVQQSVAQSKNPESFEFVQQSVAQLPWGHNCILLDKLKETSSRLFYAQETLKNGWTRDVLIHQIESGLHKRQGKLTNNFDKTLPTDESELAVQLFKDPYHLDFIMLSEQARERDLEKALISQIKNLLLELGDGFAFMAQQKRFEVDGKEFFVDLLFYHTKLRRYIIIELKIGDFEPEYVSKMNLYMGLADDQLKGRFDEPTIGLILCKTKNKVVAEYSLRDTSKPIGIAEYKIAERLPEDIKSEFPSIEELEQRIDEELKEHESSFEKKLTSLKRKISKLSLGEAQPKTIEAVREIYSLFLLPYYERIYQSLIDNELLSLFISHEKVVYINGSGNPFHNQADFDLALIKDDVRSLGVGIVLQGFKKAGTKAFDIHTYIQTEFFYERYDIKLNCGILENKCQKIYHQIPSKEEFNQLEEFLINAIIENMDEKIDNLSK